MRLSWIMILYIIGSACLQGGLCAAASGCETGSCATADADTGVTASQSLLQMRGKMSKMQNLEVEEADHEEQARSLTLGEESNRLDREIQAFASSLEPGKTTREFLQTLHLCAKCNNLARFGEPNDGGYVMCTDGLDTGLKAAYSYGVNGFDGWGMQVASQYHIPVNEYDCKHPLRPVPCAGCNVTFHDECILNADGMPKPAFKTLATQLAESGCGAAAERSLLLKIDVEAAEWSVFAEEPPENLRKFREIVVEYHYLSQQDKHPLYLQAVKKVQMAGFAVAHLHGNNDRPLDTFGQYRIPDVLEVTYVQWPEGGCATDLPYHVALDEPNIRYRPELGDAVLPDK